MNKKICQIYRCSKKEGMYIYMDKQAVVDNLPEAIKKRAGPIELAMTLVITPDKKLANANAKDVITAIDNQGFYLQMPPSLAQEQQHTMDAINDANQLLER